MNINNIAGVWKYFCARALGVSCVLFVAAMLLTAPSLHAQEHCEKIAQDVAQRGLRLDVGHMSEKNQKTILKLFTYAYYNNCDEIALDPNQKEQIVFYLEEEHARNIERVQEHALHQTEVLGKNSEHFRNPFKFSVRRDKLYFRKWSTRTKEIVVQDDAGLEMVQDFCESRLWCKSRNLGQGRHRLWWAKAELGFYQLDAKQNGRGEIKSLEYVFTGLKEDKGDGEFYDGVDLASRMNLQVHEPLSPKKLSPLDIPARETEFRDIVVLPPPTPKPKVTERRGSSAGPSVAAKGREDRPRPPITVPGRVTGELLADPKALPDKKRVLIVLDGSASTWMTMQAPDSRTSYFDLACDAALKTLNLMDNDTEVAIVVTQKTQQHPIVLRAWSSLSDAKQRIASLRKDGPFKFYDFAQGRFVHNPGGEEGMAAVLSAAKDHTQPPDLMLFMHDGGLSNTAMQAEIRESGLKRNFPIHFKPFGVKTREYRTYFSRVPQISAYGDVILPHDF